VSREEEYKLPGFSLPPACEILFHDKNDWVLVC